MKHVLMLMFVLFNALVHATPQVVNVTARQVRPWQGLVEISYELTEDVVAPEGHDLDTQIVCEDRENDRSYSCGSFTSAPSYEKGRHRLVWNAKADGVAFVSSNVVFTVTVSIHDAGYLYCVIDLSGGTTATSYPVTELADVPSGGWTDEYKTSKLVLRRIKAGTFTMGGRSTDYPGASNSRLHDVTLTKPFYIGVFEVTQRQWELVMGTKPSYFANATYYASRPVEKVSYNMIRGSSAGAGWPANNAVDATSFLGKLWAKTGLDFDLPTEAQWEYACRAGTTTALNSGKNLTSTGQDSNMDAVGRYSYNSGESSSAQASWTTSKGTAKVGSYAPNAWGLYDMHGNVYEWCLDWYGTLSSSAATDPAGSSSGSRRVIRGGSWFNYAGECRSAYRDDYNPSFEHYYYGFRLVWTP